MDRRHRHLIAGVATIAVMAGAVGGCSSSDDDGSDDDNEVPAASEPERTAVTAPLARGSLDLPPAGAAWDYQLGGGYEPAAGVGVVFRDRTDEPETGLFSVCYVNGFQTQPDELDWWVAEHPELLASDGGELVVDPDWPDEVVLDIGSGAARRELVEIVGEWIDGCARSGFDAVEIDNLDTFSRFPELFDADDAVAYAGELIDRAHRAGLPIAQKNSAELLGLVRFDFVIVEQCAEYDECGDFVDEYGRLVFDVEYDDGALERACAEGVVANPIRRDRELLTPETEGYLRATC